MHSLALFLMQSQPDPAAIRQIAAMMLVILPILMIVCFVIIILPFWFILKKAGFSPWLTFINIIPFGTLILLYVLAFAEWKVIPAPQTGWQPPYPPQA